MAHYELHLVPEPVGNFDAFIETLCAQPQHHDLASGVLDEVEDICDAPVRSRDARIRLSEGPEVHFFRTYALGVRLRGVPFAMLCFVIEQDRRRAHLLGGWLCETEDAADRAVEQALERARAWLERRAATADGTDGDPDR